MSGVPLDRVDLDGLGELVDSREWEAGYLDPATGEVHALVDGTLLGTDGEAEEPGAGWRVVSGGSGAAAHADMEHFVANLADRRLAERLGRALDGKGAARRFRECLRHEADETTGRAWSAYERQRSKLRALDWLVGEGLVTRPETAGVRSALEAAARATLREVGPTTSGARLVLLNGMPGAGKSTLAERYKAEHPGVLCLEVDALRSWIGGDPDDHGEVVRLLALALARAHLQTGYDVVVPLLVARVEEVERFEQAALEAGAELVEVVLHGGVVEARVPDAALEHLVSDAHGLADVVARRPHTHRLATRHGEVDSAYNSLVDLLDPDLPA